MANANAVVVVDAVVAVVAVTAQTAKPALLQRMRSKRCLKRLLLLRQQQMLKFRSKKAVAVRQPARMRLHLL